MAIAGLGASVKISGTAVVITDEACSLVSGQVYQITNADRRCLDPATAIVVKNNGVAVDAADIADIDLLHGKVTFDGSYTVTGDVTLTGAYLPLSSLAYARSFSVAFSDSMADATVFLNTVRARAAVLKDVTGSIGVLDDGETEIDSVTMRARLTGGTAFVVEINPGSGSVLRVRSILQAMEVGAGVEDLVTDDLSWEVAATTSTDGYDVSYSWS